jgi:osmotically-inducible protein OsmY
MRSRFPAALACLTLLLAGPGLRAGVLEDRAIEDLVRQSFVLRRVVSDPAMVQVFVSRGVIELRGQVAHEEERQLVGDALSRIAGVVRVDNRLFVDSAGRRTTVGWKADRLRSHLMARGDIALTPLAVRTREDAIELSGPVRTAAEREAIGAIATAFAAPFAARNLLAVDPEAVDTPATVDDASIGALVHEAVSGLAAAQIRARDITSVAGKVTLEGTVGRAADVASAERLAAGVRGVRTVENRLTVRP